MVRITIFSGLFFLLYLTAISSYSQENCKLELSGIITDQQTQEPLPGATIIIEGTSKGTIADINGHFEVRNLCEGHYTFSISFIGYQSHKETITIEERTSKNFSLQSDDIILKGIIIETERQEFSNSQMASSIKGVELESEKGKSLGEILTQVSGVSTLQTGPTIFKPVIHGLHSQRLTILNNGVSLQGQQWGVEHAPEIDPNIASEITIIKGAGAVRYGPDAIGGVVLVDPPSIHDTDEIKGELNVRTMSNGRVGIFSGMVEGGSEKFKNLGWRVQGTAKRGGDHNTPDYNLTNTGMKEYNFSGALGYKNNKGGAELYISSFNNELGILRSAHIGNLTDLQDAIGRNRPFYIEKFSYDINNPRQEVNHHLAKLKFFRRFEGLGELSATYSGQYNQRKEFDIRRGGRDEKPAISLNLISHAFGLALDHQPLGLISGNVGIDAELKNNRNEPGTGIRPILPAYDEFTTGIYLIEKYTARNWGIEAGLRYDYRFLRVRTFDSNEELIKPEFNFNLLSASAGAEYWINEHINISTNFGYSARPPHTIALFSTGLHTGIGSIEEGILIDEGEITIFPDKSFFSNEESIKWTNSLQYQKENVSLELTGYYNHFNNYIFLNPRDVRLTIRGAFPVFAYDQTDAYFLGMDIGADIDFSDQWNYHGHASFLKVKNLNGNGHLPFIPANNLTNSLQYNFGDLKRLEDLFISATVENVFKQNRAPKVVPVSEITNRPDATAENEIYDFVPAPKGYSLLNLDVGFSVPVLEKNKLSFRFGVENIFNTAYRNYMNRLKYYVDNTGRNFSVSLLYNFHTH